MRYLILSDIHANREALESVLKATDKNYDRMLCCGDLVGYGADPAWILDWIREAKPTVVRGNHDKACAGLEDLEWFNPSARASALWTLQTLSEADREYLANLPRGPLTTDGVTLVHGSPLDEDEYLLQTRDASEIGGYLDTQITFFGHTHLQGGFSVHRNGARGIHPVSLGGSSSAIDLEPDWFYLINPGSVGQPRDGDPRAAYAIYTPEQHVVEYFRVAYDIHATQEKIRSAGLPRSLADRLAKGS